MFLETSALTGENVEETFLKCAKSILSKIESGKFIRRICDLSFCYICSLIKVFYMNSTGSSLPSVISVCMGVKV